MSKEAVFALKLESELREQFMGEARAAHRPASQLVRELMREYVDRQRASREQDAWLRGEIERGVRDANDPNVRRGSHEDVSARWAARRADLVKRAGE